MTYLRGGYEEITRPGGSLVVCGVEDARAGARVTPADELVRRAREKCPDGFLLFLGHRNDWLRRYRIWTWTSPWAGTPTAASSACP